MDVEDDLSLIDDSLKKVVFFDYSSEYFTKLVPKLPSTDYDFQVITTLPELNQILQSGEDSIIIFHYNAAPKAVNQLSGQIKSKFKNSKTVIVAKGLSPDKANAHKASKSGANAYLSVPFSIKQFKNTIDNL
jgi:response regulator RpfG family c-di-GMP phosphodiesterase